MESFEKVAAVAEANDNRAKRGGARKGAQEPGGPGRSVSDPGLSEGAGEAGAFGGSH
jgi:hypothetical protein